MDKRQCIRVNLFFKIHDETRPAHPFGVVYVLVFGTLSNALNFKYHSQTFITEINSILPDHMWVHSYPIVMNSYGLPLSTGTPYILVTTPDCPDPSQFKQAPTYIQQFLEKYLSKNIHLHV